MRTQGGGATAEEIGRFSDPILPGQYVTNCVERRNKENILADKAEMPIKLSFVRMNVVCRFHENRQNVGCAFMLLLWVHGLCKGSNRSNINAGEVVQTYLTVCITQRLDLLIGNVMIDGIVVFGIRGVRLHCIVFLTNWGSMAWAGRLASRCIAWFALEVHDVVGIDRLGRWARSARRASCGRRHFCDGVKRGRGLALNRRGSGR